MLEILLLLGECHYYHQTSLCTEFMSDGCIVKQQIIGFIYELKRLIASSNSLQNELSFETKYFCINLSNTGEKLSIIRKARLNQISECHNLLNNFDYCCIFLMYDTTCCKSHYSN